MAMISGGIAVAALKFAQEAKIKHSGTECRTIRQAAQSHLFESGGSCPTVRELVNLRLLDSSTSGADPWGNEYKVTCGDDDVLVVSSGPDRQPSTEDDIVVPATARHDL